MATSNAGRHSPAAVLRSHNGLGAAPSRLCHRVAVGSLSAASYGLPLSGYHTLRYRSKVKLLLVSPVAAEVNPQLVGILAHILDCVVGRTAGRIVALDFSLADVLPAPVNQV